MQQTFQSHEIEIGYHPSGYKIDKTASPLERYTRYDIDENDNWYNCVPVRFDEMPSDGWIKFDNRRAR